MRKIRILPSNERNPAAKFMTEPTPFELVAIPRPERAREPLLGSDDGKWIFESIFAALKNKTFPAAA